MGRIKEINYFRAAAALRIVVPLIWVVSLRFGFDPLGMSDPLAVLAVSSSQPDMLDVKVLSIQLTLAIVCYQ